MKDFDLAWMIRTVALSTLAGIGFCVMVLLIWSGMHLVLNDQAPMGAAVIVMTSFFGFFGLPLAIHSLT
ncbi:MAG: hypothetical protein AAFV53_10490 [Myxococcota bacterium]